MKQCCFVAAMMILFFGLSVPDVTGKEIEKEDPLFLENVMTDSRSIQVSRQRLADILAYMEANPGLFSKSKTKEKRLLSHRQRADILQVWQAFLDRIVALDDMGQRYNFIYRRAKGKKKAAAFRVAYAAFLAQYRYALDFLDVTEKDPSMHIILNEPVPELGIEKDAYKKVKFRFLNVLRGAEFARLNIVYRYYKKDPKFLPTDGMEDDIKVIWRYGKGKGPEQTAKNGLRIIQDTLFTVWFPVQKEVSEMMGDIKVWRPGKSLISEKQIRGMIPKLEPGDILLERREWYMTNVGLPGFWPHAALYIGTPENRKKYFDSSEMKMWVESMGSSSGKFETMLQDRYPEAYKLSLKPQEEGNIVRVIEAIGEGVSFTTLEHSAGGADSVVVLRPRVSKEMKALAIYRAFGYSGRPYDFNFDFLTDATLVCTELVYKSYLSTKSLKGLNLPIKEILGRKAMPANEMARMFDEEYGTGKEQLDFVYFLDGYEFKNKAVESDVAAFRKSWRRPKWHILIKETALAKY